MDPKSSLFEESPVDEKHKQSPNSQPTKSTRTTISTGTKRDQDEGELALALPENAYRIGAYWYVRGPISPPQVFQLGFCCRNYTTL